MGERSYSQAPSSAETCLNYTRYLAPKLLLGQTPRKQHACNFRVSVYKKLGFCIEIENGDSIFASLEATYHRTTDKILRSHQKQIPAHMSHVVPRVTHL